MRDRSALMSEAARLTRDGRLAEAMALLRGAPMQGGDASGSPRKEATELGGGVLERVREHLPEGLRGLLDRLPGGGLHSAEGPRADRDAADQGADMLAGEFGNAAGTRAYRLFVPSSMPRQPQPLLVLLHGCTQSPEDIAAGTAMNALGEAEGCFILYPGQSQAANHSKCWNWFNPGDRQRDQGELSIIAGMIRRIARDFPVDARRIFVAGMSAGGAAAANLAAAYPDLFAGLGVHSGLPVGAAHDLPSALKAMTDGGHAAADRHDIRVPTIVFHGDRDSTVNPEAAEAIIAQVRRGAGAALQPTATVQHDEAVGGLRFTRSRQCDRRGRPLLEYWLVEGLGHAWSGGNPRGSYTDPRGPDASAAMFRFFLEQQSTGG